MKTIQELIDTHFIAMCEQGNLEQVKYWLTSPNLESHANINADNGGPIISACLKGHLSIIQFLLTSPDLIEHADIHLANDMAFRFAYAKYSLDYSVTKNVIDYLVMIYGIKLTNTIQEEMRKFPNAEVSKMFFKRTVHIYDGEKKHLKRSTIQPKLYLIKSGS